VLTSFEEEDACHSMRRILEEDACHSMRRRILLLWNASSSSNAVASVAMISIGASVNDMHPPPHTMACILFLKCRGLGCNDLNRCEYYYESAEGVQYIVFLNYLCGNDPARRWRNP
jgi:hypothetical protein